MKNGVGSTAFWERLGENVIVEGVTDLIVVPITFSVLWLFYLAAQWIWRTSVIQQFDKMFGGSPWSRRVSKADGKIQAALHERGVPIVVFANHKGGVGKTTTALNFGAFLAKHRRHRVLFIDLDYQGSLSMTLRALAAVQTGDRFGATQLFDPDANWRSSAPPRRSLGPDYSHSDFLDADEGLALNENKLMARWAMRMRRRDVRFILCHFLDDLLATEDYHVVIIDAPPRSTTAEINAIAAATHLIVPTKLDRISIRGASKFIDQVTELDAIRPKGLRFSGFVGTMRRQREKAPAPPPGLDLLDEAISAIEKEQAAKRIDGRNTWIRSLSSAPVAFTYIREDVIENAGICPTVDGAARAPSEIRDCCEAIEQALRDNGAVF